MSLDPVLDFAPGWRRTRLKRRILAELVEENLDQIRGGLPRRHRRRRVLGNLRLLALALLPLSLFAPSHTAPPAGPGSGIAEAAMVAPAEEPVAAPGRSTARAAVTDLEPVNAAVFPLAVERVVIDPGHGGRSGGTATPSGLEEKEITLDIGLRLADLLEEAGFEVVLTRQDDEEVTLRQRAALANEAGADLFVSIHVNWIPNRGVRGVETYYLGTSDDPFVHELAAEENRGSGYSQAHLRTLLDELYADLRQDSSRRLAEAVQRTLLRSLRTVNPAVEDRGVKTAPFIVLMTTEMPAILAEVSCLSNAEEAELLSRPLYRQYIAEALLAGVRSYATAHGDPPPAATPITTSTSTTASHTVPSTERTPS